MAGDDPQASTLARRNTVKRTVQDLSPSYQADLMAMLSRRIESAVGLVRLPEGESVVAIHGATFHACLLETTKGWRVVEDAPGGPICGPPLCLARVSATVSDQGHRDTFSPPSKGWPTFGPDGRVVRDEQDDEAPEDRHD